MNKQITWKQEEVIRLLKQQPGTYYQQANDAEKSIMRDWVRDLLNAQAATIEFVKADGSVREMQCTLNWHLIPAAVIEPPLDPLAESTHPKKERKQPDPEVIRVFDLQAGAWRSFRMDRLKKISAEIAFSHK
jgi:hypothetical protein